MQYATMFINPGVEVNLARQALYIYMSTADAQSLIPDEGGYVANLFNNERSRDVDTWIEAIHGAIHENRERHRQHEREQQARQHGRIICPNCSAAVKPRYVQAYTSYGNRYEQTVCPQCGADVE
jgi:uncharacterized protein (UPF0212 family)